MSYPLGEEPSSTILELTGASDFRIAEVIQELWSGYGQILRLSLDGGESDTIIVKHVRMPVQSRHPRGWNSNRSHERKVFSYRVESEWYQNWSARCDAACRIPRFLFYQSEGEEVLLGLEDLDAAGFPARHSHIGTRQIELCLKWLAEFHATFLGESPTGLWKTGTYWHLETRPDELDALEDKALKSAAPAIDQRLSAAHFQSFVHGDAKLANFCFSANGEQVAMVDFQYVGGGCGMKDVAYFIGSCLDESSCEDREQELLACYLASLEQALNRRQPQIDSNAVISEWRALFPLAWTDFHRFLKGWCPGHWKINSYSERLARQVLEDL